MVGQREVKVYPRASTCILAGHCLGFSTNCALFPIDNGLCRERTEVVRIDDMSTTPEVEHYEEYREDVPA